MCSKLSHCLNTMSIDTTVCDTIVLDKLTLTQSKRISVSRAQQIKRIKEKNPFVPKLLNYF